MDDGIYYGLPADEYHAEQRLSASLIQKMLISPSSCWAASWMNPEKEEQDQDTKARVVGRAYHMARLEPHLFKQAYMPAPDKADYEAREFLMTATDIKEQLKLIGEPQSKAGEGVLDAAIRLKGCGYGGGIWHLVMDEFEKELQERQAMALDARVYGEIVRDMERIHGQPEIAKHLTGGTAEVSIFWTDTKTALPMKCRIDYLRPSAVVDFKTFDNAVGKHLDKCINDAVLYNRYYIQALLYWQVTEIIRTSTADELPERIMDGGTSSSIDGPETISKIRDRASPLEVWYVFQEKRGIPNVLARQFQIFSKLPPGSQMNVVDDEQEAKLQKLRERKTLWAARAELEIRHAISEFANYREAFGDEPWPPRNQIGVIDDDCFPQRWLEE